MRDTIRYNQKENSPYILKYTGCQKTYLKESNYSYKIRKYLRRYYF